MVSPFAFYITANPTPIQYPTVAQQLSPANTLGPPLCFGLAPAQVTGPAHYITSAQTHVTGSAPTQAVAYPVAPTAPQVNPGSIGASSHLNNSVNSLSDIFNTCMYPSISVGDGHSIPVTNMGHSASLMRLHGGSLPRREVLRHLVSNNFISCNKEKPHVLCHACQLGKHVRLPFVSSNTVVTSCFEIIHSDVWTSPIPSLPGFKYYVLFLDHYSQFVWVYPLLNKSDVWSKFVLFHTYVRTQFKCEIRSFQCDHSGEFDNRNFHKLFADNGIQFRFSCPKTSQQNGKSERMWTDTAYLLLYVDDIVLTASSEILLQQIIRSLHQEFAMTDLGPLNYFLGKSVSHDSSGLFLSQKK
ncbi:ribonuclease H-like domain-containing protein [Tanacetum coccineum]